MKNIKQYSLGVVLLVLAACATTELRTYTYKFGPVDGGSFEWEQGFVVHTSETREFRMRISQKNPELPVVFHVGIENISAEKLEVSHENFRISGPAVKCLDSVAQDPQLLVDSFDEAYKKERAYLKALIDLDRAQSLSELTKRWTEGTNTEEKIEEHLGATERAREIQQQRVSLNSLLEAKERARNSLVFKTTLARGQKLSGDISFDCVFKTGRLALEFYRSGNELLKAEFMVSKIEN